MMIKLFEKNMQQKIELFGFTGVCAVHEGCARSC